MVRARGSIRPPYPFRLNSDSPEAIGLLSWLPVIGGASLRDWFVPSTDLPVVNAANLVTSEFGLGLDSFSANDVGARLVTPAYLKGLNPVTLTWTGMSVAAASTNSEIFGVSDNNTDTSPYVTYGIGFDGSSKLRGEFTTSFNTFFEVTSGIALTKFSLTQVVFTLTGNDQRVYLNGIQVAINTATGFTGGIAGASSQYCVGINASNLARSPGIVTYDARVYNRLFSVSDIATMWDNGNPWGLYARNPVVYPALVSTAVTSITTPQIMAALGGSFVDLRRRPRSAVPY